MTEEQLQEAARTIKVLKEHPDFWCTYESVRKAIEHMANGGSKADAYRMLVMYGDEL